MSNVCVMSNVIVNVLLCLPTEMIEPFLGSSGQQNLTIIFHPKKLGRPVSNTCSHSHTNTSWINEDYKHMLNQIRATQVLHSAFPSERLAHVASTGCHEMPSRDRHRDTYTLWDSFAVDMTLVYWSRHVARWHYVGVTLVFSLSKPRIIWILL